MQAVTIKKLCKIYDIKGKRVNALDHINLDIEQGSFVTIVGKSGCGKTTLLRILAGLENKTSGDVTFSKDIERVGIMFQEPRLMPWLTVKDNLGFSMLNIKDKDYIDKTVDKYLEMLGLWDFKDAYPSQISGGMAQRTALGRTLCYNPDLILMDEPLGALDAFNRRKLQNDLIEILNEHKKTIIFVTHDVDEAVYLGQKVIAMDNGIVLKELNIDMPYPRKFNSENFLKIREELLSLILNE
ncbi:MAG: ABC transporter ATP-binding protein [Solirubrobacterales bacterium]